ncbi:MAG: hypothetical protein PHP82_04495 [Candidatus ainarchaeum sp.]|nr:hypothetical protein [Candidatus ainarchaeum sp.]
MISNKGFFFTISIILFASTIVIFAQTYANNDIDRETRILSNYAVLSQTILNNNLGNNLKRIVDFDLQLGFEEEKIIVVIKDFLPKKINISQAINDYEVFLENDFFPNVSGSKSVDFSNLKDGSFEVFFGDLFVYDIDYILNKTSFNSNNSLISTDLNLFSMDDLNYYEWSPSVGSVDLNINYFDNSNFFQIFDNISSSEESVLNLVYYDSNIILVFGRTTNNNSFFIDSNSSNRIDFKLKFEYDFDSNNIPVWANGLFNYSSGNVSSSSMLKIAN